MIPDGPVNFPEHAEDLSGRFHSLELAALAVQLDRAFSAVVGRQPPDVAAEFLEAAVSLAVGYSQLVGPPIDPAGCKPMEPTL